VPFNTVLPRLPLVFSVQALPFPAEAILSKTAPLLNRRSPPERKTLRHQSLETVLAFLIESRRAEVQ
jgi:hypothetical protein